MTDPKSLATVMSVRLLRHDRDYALSTLVFRDGELRVPIVDATLGAALQVKIDARDVSIALSRPMDVSITNRLPGTIIEVERLSAPYARVTFDLGTTKLDALVTWESVDRLALEPGVRAWAMIKTVSIDRLAIKPEDAPSVRSWPPVDRA